MAGSPRRSPSKVLTDTPSARAKETSAATEGWRSPDSNRERCATELDRQASSSSVSPARLAPRGGSRRGMKEPLRAPSADCFHDVASEASEFARVHDSEISAKPGRDPPRVGSAPSPPAPSANRRRPGRASGATAAIDAPMASCIAASQCNTGRRGGDPPKSGSLSRVRQQPRLDQRTSGPSAPTVPSADPGAGQCSTDGP